MTDKTLGAYQRHEKHDAADFANAEFARHPDGRASHRTNHPTMGSVWQTTPSRGSTGIWWGSDADMAEEGGWSPVRECPDPEQHDDARDDLLRLGRLVREAQQDRAGSVQIGGVKIAPCDTFGRTNAENAERTRAEKAEKERDENGALLSLAHDALANTESQRDELRSLYEGQIEVIGRLQRPAAESRPLTPDAITDEMLYRGLSAYYNIETTTARWDADRAEDFRRALAAALTEPPARPEGAEEIERLLMDADRDGGEVYRTDGYTRLADYLAEGLSKGGVRVVGEDGAA